VPSGQVELRLWVRLTPRPAEQAEPCDEADGAGDRPERAARHRGALDQPASLADPDDAHQDEHSSHHTPRDDHAADYARTAEAGFPSVYFSGTKASEGGQCRRSSSRASKPGTTTVGARCSTRTIRRAREKAKLQRVLRSTDDPDEVFIYHELENIEDANEARDRLLSSGVLDRFTDKHGPNVLIDAG
jgi:hypothetical protein